MHSIGIGNDASEYLIKESAKKGKGSFIFLKNASQDLSSLMLSFLKKSLTPFFDSFSIEYNNDIV